MDFTFGDLFEKKIFEALDTCVFVVISTAIRQLPINIFISGTVDHSVFTVYIPKLEHTSTLGSWVIVSDISLGYRLLDLISGFFVLVSVDFTALDIGIGGCTLVCPLPFLFTRDQGKLSKLIFGCRSGYTYHLIGCNSMPACFHFLFEGSTENYN